MTLALGAASDTGRAYIAGGADGLAAVAGLPVNVRKGDLLEALSRANVYRNWNLLPDDHWRERVVGYLRDAGNRDRRGEWIPSVLDESRWLTEVGSRGSSGGGLAGLLAWDLRAAQAYSGLAKAGPGVADTLAAAVGLKRLAGRYGELLYLYGASMALNGQGVEIPGGEGSRRIWNDLTGESPQNAGKFLAALMERDSGRLLAWFAFLHELPARHQRFYLSGLPRAKAYYALFRDAPEMSNGVKRRIIYGSTTDFLRGVPVGEDGLVRLPGGLSAWQGTGKAGKESIDQTLLRLGREREVPKPGNAWGWQRLEAVAYIEKSRGKALTASEARMLAEEFQDHAGLYGYFVSLRTLGESDWRSIFSLAGKAQRLDPLDRNRLMGHFHAAAKLACLLVHAGSLDEVKAGDVVSRLSDELADGNTAIEWAQAAARALRSLAGGAPSSVEEAIEASLCDCERRKREFLQVMSMQCIPSADLSLDLVDGASGMKLSGQGWESVVAAAERLPEMPPEALDAAGAAKAVRADVTARARDTAARIRKAMSGLEPPGADIAKLKAEMEDRAADVLLLTTTGLIYSWYLRPYDLLASDDPWFARKHRYVSVRGRDDEPGDFAPGYFRMQSGGIGSYVGGSLANFSEAVGQVAAVGSIPDTRVLESLQFMQLGVLRGMMLGRLKAVDFRAAYSLVQAGREWIDQAGRGRISSLEMWETTAGLLLPGRWQQALVDLRANRSQEASRKITLSDLYWIGLRRQAQRGGDPARYLRQWPSVPGMRPVAGDVPPMTEPWPYESMCRRGLPGESAARLAELGLVLAVVAGRDGLAPEELEAGAERLVSRLLEALQMVDGADWESVNATWASINADAVRAAAREVLSQ